MEIISKILISADVINDDVVRYLASRYRCNPQDIISRFLKQERYIKTPNNCERVEIPLEENEMEILRDMNICPSEIEFI